MDMLIDTHCFFINLTMAKTTYKERQKRRHRAAELLAGGLSPADAVSRLTAEWGCSRRTSLRDVNLGQDALLESIFFT